jgi:hypothetical protein
MTAFDRFDPFEQRITDAIDEIAMARRPDYLDDVLQLTVRSSQRPRWTFPERWLPMDAAVMPVGIGRRRQVRLLLLLAALAALLIGALALIGTPRSLPPSLVKGVFERTGDLVSEVGLATTLRLTNGSVMIADGLDLQRYDPATGQFTRFAQPQFQIRGWTQLANGDLVVLRVEEEPSDPPTGRSWVVAERLPAAGPAGTWLEIGRSAFFYLQTAVALPDGRLAILGQDFGSEALSALVFDPASGRFTRGASTPLISNGEHATLLPDGRILVVDQPEAPTMNLVAYDPGADAFASLGRLPFAAEFSTTVLRDGRVLIAGGGTQVDTERALSDAAFLVDPARGAIVPVGPLPVARWMHGAAMTADGRVLIAGGSLEGAVGTPTSSTLLFDPTSLAFVAGPTLLDGRMNPTAVTLSDGRILIFGHTTLVQGPPSGPGVRAEVFR